MYFWFESEKEAKTVTYAIMVLEIMLFVVGAFACANAIYTAIIAEYALFVKIIGVALYAPAAVIFSACAFVEVKHFNEIASIFWQLCEWPEFEEEAES